MAKRVTFTEQEKERYSRHFVLPEVGIEGQKRLRDFRVLIVGVGGLGSPVGLYLAAAGVGTIGIVDHDIVSLSNLQRQVLYSTDDVGKNKASTAQARLLAINPTIRVHSYPVRLDPTNALQILDGYDIVADCSDNFPTRYLVNDACVLTGKKNVYGSVFQFEGQVSVFDPLEGGCYRCVYPLPPPPELVQDCSHSGVLGVLPGIIGTLQANEVIKLILAKGVPLIGRVLFIDSLASRAEEIRVVKDARCPACGLNRTITSLIDYEQFCSGRNTPGESDMSVSELKRRLDEGDPVLLLDVREQYESEICSIGGALIPLNQLEGRMGELDASSEIVVYCHHGVRSRVAATLLRRSGFSRVRNLVGGVDAWAREIDTRMPSY